MQRTFLNFIVINTSAFGNINLLSNSNGIYLHLSKLKPRASRRNIVGNCCVRLHVPESFIGFKLCATTCNRVCKRTQRVTFVVTEVFWKSFWRFFSSFKFLFCFIKWVKVGLVFFHVGVFLFWSFSTARGFT